MLACVERELKGCTKAAIKRLLCDIQQFDGCCCLHPYGSCAWKTTRSIQWCYQQHCQCSSLFVNLQKPKVDPSFSVKPRKVIWGKPLLLCTPFLPSSGVTEHCWLLRQLCLLTRVLYSAGHTADSSNWEIVKSKTKTKIVLEEDK